MLHDFARALLPCKRGGPCKRRRQRGGSWRWRRGSPHLNGFTTMRVDGVRSVRVPQSYVVSRIQCFQRKAFVLRSLAPAVGAELRDNQFFSQGPNDAITTSAQLFTLPSSLPSPASPLFSPGHPQLVDVAGQFNPAMLRSHRGLHTIEATTAICTSSDLHSVHTGGRFGV